MKKVCSKCGLSKETSDFSKNSSSPDGLQHRCKECFKEHYRSRREFLLKTNR